MTLRVLLIEAELAERERLAEVLQSAGYRLEFAENLPSARLALGRTSVDLALVSAAREERVDSNLVHWLRSCDAPANMPIIVVSGDISTKARLECFHAGADDYVARPFDRTHFLTRISNVMALRDGRPSINALGISRRILIVDDSPTYGHALSDELQKDGHDIAFAETGRDALTYLESRKADLVILDVFLPDLNGVEVCRRIKAAERTSSLPVLMLTGREKSAVRTEAAAANADEFAVKSTDLESIRNKVRALLVRNPNRKNSASRLNAITGDASSPPAAPSGRMRVAENVDSSSVQKTPSVSRLAAVNPNRQAASSGQMRALSVDAHHSSTTSRSRISVAKLSSASSDHEQLFENVVRLTGLSDLLARTTVESVCQRLNLDAHALDPRDLRLVLEKLEVALQLFLPANEARQRLAALNTLVR